MTIPHTPRVVRHGLALAFLLLAAALFPPALRAQQDSAAAPQRWQRIVEDERMSLWFDTQTVRTGEGSVLIVWTDWRFATARENRSTGQPFDSMRSQEEINCETGMHRPLRTRFYMEGQSVGAIDEPDEWKEPVPDSRAEAMVLGICAWAEEDA